MNPVGAKVQHHCHGDWRRTRNVHLSVPYCHRDERLAPGAQVDGVEPFFKLGDPGVAGRPDGLDTMALRSLIEMPGILKLGGTGRCLHGQARPLASA